MPKTIVKIDLSESPYKNDMIHNRWHPDVPIIEWVKPGEDFVMETYDWTGGFIKNNEFGRRRARHRSLASCISCPVRSAFTAPSLAICWSSIFSTSAPSGEPVGLQRLLLQEERRRLSHRPFPAGAKVDLGHFRPLHPFPSRPRRQFRRARPSRPDRLSARSENARSMECARAGA